jgi:signal transduction histidine kinase
VALFPPEFSWARYLASARALLGSVSLLAALVGVRAPSPFYYGLLVVFLMYSLVVAVRLPARDGTFALLQLFGDTVFFLIISVNAAENALWTAAIFYLYLIVSAVVLHGPREVALVVCIAALFGLVKPASSIAGLERTVLVGGVLGCAVAVVRKRHEGRVAGLVADLEEARAASGRAVEAERARIASDFHDGPLQNFISLQMRLEILRKLLERDASAGMEELRQMQVTAQAQVRELRAFLRSMRPLEVDGSNLVASIRRTAELFQKESGVPVTFVGGDQTAAMSPEVAQEVLQMVREALHNIQKHAAATRVAVALERSDRTLEISIDDNGHGFSFVGAYSLEELDLLKIGPVSLKRRARSVNAEMTLESRPGRGSGIKLRIPVQ